MIAFVFPGQGAQVVGMGKDFYENSELSKNIFDEAAELLDFDVKRIKYPALNISAGILLIPKTASGLLLKAMQDRRYTDPRVQAA